MPITVADVHAAEQAVNHPVPRPAVPAAAATPQQPPRKRPREHGAAAPGPGATSAPSSSLPPNPGPTPNEMALRRNILAEIHRVESLYKLEPNHGIGLHSSSMELESHLERVEMEMNGEGDVAILRDFTSTAAWLIEGGSMLVPGVDLTDYQSNVEKQMHTMDKLFRDLIRKYGGSSMGPEAAIAMRLGQIALQTHRQNTSNMYRLINQRRDRQQQQQEMEYYAEPEQQQQQPEEPPPPPAPKEQKRERDVLEANNLTIGIPAPKAPAPARK
jgi:hypothetical protein